MNTTEQTKLIKNCLQYNLSNDEKVYTNPSDIMGNPVEYISKLKHTSYSAKEFTDGFVGNSTDFLADINESRKTFISDISFKADYDTVTPLQKLNMASCGDTANMFLMNINEASISGFGRFAPGYCEGCPAGDSPYNVFGNTKYNSLSNPTSGPPQ